MKEVLIILLILLLSSFISSSCDPEQIDINSASLEELDRLEGIGPSKAQAIINSRPFYSIEDLINVSGIGEITLEKIINQNLACVLFEENPIEEPEEEIIKEDSGKEEEETKEIKKLEEIKENDNKTIEKIVNKTPIILKAKDIKSENSRIEYEEFALISLIAFFFLIGTLLFLRSKKYKTEFE